MRHIPCLTIAIALAFALLPTPASAQFAAEGEAEEQGVPEAAPAAAPQPADEGTEAAPAAAVPLADRTVGDLAGAALGAKGAQHVQAATAIMREVVQTGAASGGASSASPTTDSAVSLVRGLIGLARRKKDAPTPPQ